MLAPLMMHALLLALWWGFFRWVGRSEASPGVAAACAWAGSLALLAALVLRGRRGTLALALALPRLGPASFFLAVLVMRPPAAPLWAWAAAFVPPWLFVTGWLPTDAPNGRNR